MNNLSRRSFLTGSMAAVAMPSVAKAMASEGPKVDERLSVFLSDMHVAHPNPKNIKETWQPTHQNPYFERAVSEVLAMRPLPKRAVIFGDIALWYGWRKDYETSKPTIDRLREAGVEVTMTMGNHDHRESFLDIYREYAKPSPVEGRIVSVVDLGGVDLLLMDSLNENAEGEGSRNIVSGTLDQVQQDWLVETAKAAKRPFLVGAHHPANELKVGAKPLMEAMAKQPMFIGMVHGHEHCFETHWHHFNDNPRPMYRSACLPSTGWWGDIGFATMRILPDQALLTLVEDEFIFPKPTKEGKEPPKEWADIAAEKRGATCRFRF